MKLHFRTLFLAFALLISSLFMSVKAEVRKETSFEKPEKTNLIQQENKMGYYPKFETFKIYVYDGRWQMPKPKGTENKS